jgi:arylsulfatase A-like enzyme
MLRVVVSALILCLWLPASAVTDAAREKPPAVRRPNILIVTFDTTRADRIGAYGYPSHTPNIDRLAAEGVRMAYAYTPSTQTLPSHTSLFTGLYSITHGVVSNGQMLSDRAWTLAEELHKQGYATGAIIGAATLISDFRLNQGFDTYDEQFGGTLVERTFKSFMRFVSRAKVNIPSTRTAPAVARLARAWIARHAHSSQPFFLWLHFWDAHEPYERHPDFSRPALVVSDGPTNQYGQKEANYVNEIEFADHYLGTVLNQLDSLGLTNNTLTIFTADHGESLGAHDYQGHRQEVWNDILHIPMIFRFPGHLPRGKVIDEPVMSIDVMPTALKLLGVGYAPRDYQGQDIFQLGSRPRKVFAIAVKLFTKTPIRRAVIEGPMKFVEYDDPDRNALFNVQTDPQEEHNLLAKAPEDTRARLRGEIVQWYDAYSRLTPDNPQLTDEQLERLRSLGYIKKTGAGL